jgi:RHH-type proline utilization regulon transcriptional repressor/proline dehydrogenase/delta 1-pyrroline-5-carboxylate dehydrogenase
VNRHITGAIVQRQPFGGWKRSAVGPGAKAGGPAYVAALGSWADAPDVASLDEDAWLARAVSDDAHAAEDHLAEHDATGLSVEANLLRHRRYAGVVVRCAAGTSGRDLARVLAAARAAGTPVDVSVAADAGPSAEEVTSAARRVGTHVPGVVFEDDEALAARVADLGQVVIRVIGPVAATLQAACDEHGVRLDGSAVVMSGHLEVGRLLREQAVSRTLHRYGRVVV